MQGAQAPFRSPNFKPLHLVPTARLPRRNGIARSQGSLEYRSIRLSSDCQWLSMVFGVYQCYQRFISGCQWMLGIITIINGYQSLSIVVKVNRDCQWLSMVVDDYHWLSTFNRDYQELPMVINNYQWFSMVVSDYQCLLVINNDYQWLSTSFRHQLYAVTVYSNMLIVIPK